MRKPQLRIKLVRQKTGFQLGLYKPMKGAAYLFVWPITIGFNWWMPKVERSMRVKGDYDVTEQPTLPNVPNKEVE